MEISEQLRCLFSAPVEKQGDSYVVEVPEQEVRHGELQPGQSYRVAILSSSASDDTKDATTEPGNDRGPPVPPVEEGEQRTVEIEDLGEQGDGITRVERGFVVIVPDTEQGERVTVEITDVRENVASRKLLSARVTMSNVNYPLPTPNTLNRPVQVWESQPLGPSGHLVKSGSLARSVSSS